ncbi:MAG: hypothetical protein AAGI72_24645, partial [Pseudomonadota bacterium]
WTLSSDANGDVFVSGKDGAHVCDLWMHVQNYNSDPDIKLILAAPELLTEREQARHHVSVLLDLFASLPAVPADAQETVDQIQRERDESD